MIIRQHFNLICRLNPGDSVMKIKKEDRRIRITKTAIRESLIELLEQYPISKISVKMLCETADINRSTFYAYYDNQYDLLNQIQQEVAVGIEQVISTTQFSDDTDDAIAVVVQVLEYAKANAALFRVLLSEHGDSGFQNNLMMLTQQKTLEELSGTKQIPPMVTKYVQLFVIHGIISIMRVWLADDCKDEPAMLGDFILTIITQGVNGLY